MFLLSILKWFTLTFFFFSLWFKCGWHAILAFDEERNWLTNTFTQEERTKDIFYLIYMPV